MAVVAQADLVSDIARLKLAIERAAEAAQTALTGRPSASGDDGAWAEHDELTRQLGALRQFVGVAESRNEDRGALRAELATLLSFARTLQADADAWCSAFQDRVEELERQSAAAREEHARLAVEHDKLVRRRDALQSTILQTAWRVAQQHRGEWRRTIPVVTLGDGLTVCSVTVSCPRRGFRFPKQWLVTLTRSQDVLIRRE